MGQLQSFSLFESVNTADGTRYMLTLLPQGMVATAPVAAPSSAPATTTTTPTTPGGP